MRIDSLFLDELTGRAVASERLRMNFDLRNSPDDRSQRMLNALEPGTVVPVHRHRGTSETVCVVRGAVRQNFYGEDGALTESYVVEAGGACPMFVVPAGRWHNSEAMEHGTVIFEAKDGAYEPLGAEDVMDDELVLAARVRRFVEEERRSMSMEVVTAEYVWRMWGGRVPLGEIERAFERIGER